MSSRGQTLDRLPLVVPGASPDVQPRGAGARTHRLSADPQGVCLGGGVLAYQVWEFFSSPFGPEFIPVYEKRGQG